MFNANLTNCDQEPIHIPGKIQSHGFLIATDQLYNITFCSENVSNYIALSTNDLLNKSLVFLEDSFESAAPIGFLTQLITLGKANNTFENFNPFAVQIKGETFNLIISISGDQYLLEFEPEYSDLKSDPLRIVGQSLSQMMADADLSQLLHNAAKQIKKVIGYDRVMVYKFHQDGHGEVVAEEKEIHLDTWRGLHYPASDIPKQARELYKINPTRLISNVYTEPSAVVTFANIDVNPLDLTHSVLRAVSPVHIQYLKNMEVASSFSISIICHGELWGLVACHNYTPRFINYKERESAKLIGQVLSSAIGFRQHEEDLSKSNRLKEAGIILSKGLATNANLEKILFDYPITLLDAVDATGVLFSFDDRFFTNGITPDKAFMTNLIDWLGENMDEQFYESNNFSTDYPAALQFVECASGILACRLSKELKEYMVWFRAETIHTVEWAGNPDKPVDVSAEGILRLTPRNSFDAWSQTVRFTSTPWSIEDIKFAHLIREEVAFAITRKAMEIRMQNEKLKAAYDELNSFGYTISHDLKNPLTSIKSYCQLLTRETNLTERGKHMVERILWSTDKMQQMIGEVLRYSQVGLDKISPISVDMEPLLQDLKEEILAASNLENLEINLGNPMEIYGDQTMIMQVFSNLLGNAVKYSSQTKTPIVDIGCEDIGDCIQYRISDNGIGINAEDHEKIFELFTRSKQAGEYEGTGIGLSIVKKIMEKHGGKIWIESNLTAGSTFYVLFKKPAGSGNSMISKEEI
ncbi:chemotaxis family two-component system sensor kinase Cph1 [Pedobacter sp. UYEF25]